MTGYSQAWAGPFDLPPLGDISDLPLRQQEWRAAFAEQLFGPMPDPPEAVALTRQRLPDDRVERLLIEVTTKRGNLIVDAALWLPGMGSTPASLICGLDFAGPSGVLVSNSFPLDPMARIYSRPEYGVDDGRLADVLRGTSAYRWPVDLLLSHGYAVLISCYGSWTPDDPALWRDRGVASIAADPNSGAISCWAWAISRLIDAAGQLAEVDTGQMAVAGHSRLGKAALWAAAHDTRIGAVLANNSGCGGAAPARHPVGETMAQMAEVFPHWLRPGVATEALSVDQHQLIALAAPRAVYLASAEDDLWADPLGSYQALRAASAAWGDTPDDWPDAAVLLGSECDINRGPLGHHIRPGGHDLLPYDWRRFLDFLGRQN